MLQSIKTNKGIYRIGQEIGKGRYSSVYKCIKDNTDDLYAVKVCEMKKDIGLTQPLEQFILSSFPHEFLVQSEVIHVEGEYVFMVQKMAKTDLFFHSRKFKQKIPINNIKKWVYQCIQGLNCLHSQKIIHGDVKSSNVLLYDDDSVKMADYTLSTKITNKKFQHTLYTITHRPPENLLKKSWNFKSDIWALGCTIYEIVYGTYLFDSQKNESEPMAINAILDFLNMKNSSDFNPNLAYKKANSKFSLEYGEINNFILDLLKYNVEERPSSNSLLKHPLFSEMKKPSPYLFIERNGCQLNEDDYFIFNMEIRQYKNHDRFFNLAVNLYRKCIPMIKKYNIDKDKLVKTIILLSCKIIGLAIGDRMKDLTDIELQICQYLEYRIN